LKVSIFYILFFSLAFSALAFCQQPFVNDDTIGDSDYGKVWRLKARSLENQVEFTKANERLQLRYSLGIQSMYNAYKYLNQKKFFWAKQAAVNNAGFSLLTVDLYFVLSVIYIERGRMRKAKNIYYKMKKKFPESEEAKFLRRIFIKHHVSLKQ
jgi:hypothetical protein